MDALFLVLGAGLVFIAAHRLLDKETRRNLRFIALLLVVLVAVILLVVFCTS